MNANAFTAMGLVCVLAAIVGGGLKAWGFELPLLQSGRRQTVLAIFGLVVIAIANFGAIANVIKPSPAASSPASSPAASSSPAAASSPAASSPAPERKQIDANNDSTTRAPSPAPPPASNPPLPFPFTFHFEAHSNGIDTERDCFTPNAGYHFEDWRITKTRSGDANAGFEKESKEELCVRADASVTKEGKNSGVAADLFATEVPN